MLDATRLRVLVAVARHGSVTAAAQALNYAQPSISHHMARLEAETGAKLMERSGRGIRLTEAGRLLAERAEEILGRLDAAEVELAAHVGLRQERVRVAACGSALATLGAAAAAAMLAERAGLDIRLTEAARASALRMLRAGEADVAVVCLYQHDGAWPDPGPGRLSDPRADGDLRWRLVLDEPVYLLTAAERGAPGQPGQLVEPAAGSRAQARAGGQPQAGTKQAADGYPAGNPADPIARPADPAGSTGDPAGGTGDPAAGLASLADCASQRWIACGDQHEDFLARLCRPAGFTPDIAACTADHVAAQALVAAGIGVAILPGLALRAARHPDVAAKELAGTRRQVLAVTYGDPPDPPATRQLVEALVRAAGDLPDPWGV